MSLDYTRLNPEEKKIYHTLESVIDPEIGESVIELGLIYAIKWQTDGMHISYTMTSQSCPMHELVAENMIQAIKNVFGQDAKVQLDLIWSPSWEPSMMHESAKMRLGWLSNT